jgi:uncharacterized repeat protein (TIGR02543 family)
MKRTPALVLCAASAFLFAGATLDAQSAYQYDLPGSLVLQAIETGGPPVILRQPVSQVVSSGDNGSFSVVVADTLGVTYRWLFNGSSINGASSDALLLTNVTTASEGNYTVVVGNSSGSITSAPAMLYFDSVGDGVPDLWKIQYFGNLTNVTAASDAPLHDGISNLQKFIDGINPTNGAGLKPRLVLGGLNGSVSASPDLDKYVLGQPVTLTGTPHAGYQFVSWSGDLLGTNNPAVLTLDSNKNVTGVFSLPLSSTLDATNIAWRSGGEVPWFGQDIITYDGVAAAQNGPLANSQTSWLEGTVYLSSPGLLTFWWKCVPSIGSSLTLLINGVPQYSQAPQLDWLQATYYLPAGTDIIRWTYAKQYNGGEGYDAYWIDQVSAAVSTDPIVDTDFDGLPDLWEYQYFGTLIRTPTADSDGDGVDNLQEYVDGTDPTDSRSVFPRLAVTGSGGAVSLSPSLSSYAYLQPVTLTAIPKSGYTFIGWRGDLIASTNPATLIMNQSKSVTANFAISAPNALAEALDATNLTWTSGGDASFFAQTAVAHDGVDAAQSPPLAPNQQAWFQTTVNGPGPVSFWWKSAMSFGQMQFLVNGVQQRTLSGGADWVQFSTTLPAGANTLRWVFVSNSPSIPKGDAGWVDQVVFGTNVPSVLSAPLSKTILQGSNVTFTVTAGSSGPLSYRWQKNGVNLSDGGSVSGAATNTLTITNVQPADAGNYSVLVSTPTTSVTTAAALTVIALAPLPGALDATSLTWTSGGNAAWFGQNLVSHDAVDAGQAGALLNQQESWVETTVNGPGALNFWWKVSCTAQINFFDLIVDGLTNATISGEVDWVPHSLLLAQGSHVVRWRYRQASYVPSVPQGAWLDQVSVLPGLPPAITAFPVSQVITGGLNASFSVTATGTGPLNYQWFFNRTNPIGPNASTLTLTGVQLANAGGYSVMITNALGKTTSPTADLIVVVPPFITAQPTGATLLTGTNLTLTVAAGGADPLGYQWQKDGIKLSGSTGSSFIKNKVQESDSGNYAVVVSNFPGSVTSVVAQVVVGVPPSVTSESGDQSATTGSTVTFSVSAAGTAPLFYQWEQNGFVLPGKTAPNLVLANVQLSDSGYYDVIVSNALGTVRSMGANLTVGPPSAPTIFAQPSSAIIPIGGSNTFSVQADGIPTPSYQWLRYGTNLPGATGSSLMLTNIQVADAGPYSVYVFNSAGSTTSQVATLTVGNSEITAALTVSNGTVNLVWNALVGRDYQVEYKDDLEVTSWSNLPPVITATTTSASTVDVSGNSQRRYYRIELLAQGGTLPTITVQPVSQNVSPGSSVSLTVAAEGSPPLSYQWRVNGTNLPGANSATLQLNNVQSSDTGLYDVVVSNSAGSVTSDPAFVFVF